MVKKPTYEELEQRIKELEEEAIKRKRAEEEASYELDLMQTLLSNIPEYIYFKDRERKFVRVSNQFCDLFKCNMEDIIGKKDEDLFPEEVAKETVKDDRHVIETGIPIINKVEGGESISGKEHWVLTTKLPWRDKEGNIIGLFGISKEITERKRNEEALRKSEERYRYLSESSPIGVFETDKNGSVQFLNNKWLTITGMSRQNALGFGWAEALHSEDRPRILEEWARCLEEKIGSDSEFRFVRPSGEVRWVRTRTSPVISPAGDVISHVGVNEDITERKQAEEALRESENIFSLFMEHSPIYVFFKDKNIRSIRLSRNYEKMLGRSIDELLDKTMDNLFPPDLAKSMIADDLRILNEGKPVNVEEEFNGRFYDTIKFPILINGKPKYLAGYTIDITDRKLAEEALRESEEKLARSRKMESMGLLAGGVAHDLNNVLSGIVSIPELILMDLPEDSKLRKPIKTMQESGHRAVTIVQDLLTVARGVAITKEPLNLNDIVSDYLQSPEFNKLKHFHPTVMVKTNLDTDLINISGSQVHIGKVVMNLVSNASEAIMGSGNVIISTMNRYVDRPIKGYDDVNIGEYAILSVSDDGSGISSVDLERIFEPFYTKKLMGKSGTGLGLAVVWNVVQDHKSYIDVTTDENGTTFELYFPITRDEVSNKDLSIPIEDFKGDGETILVVDDEESQRDISCNMLDTLGYKTKAVSCGEEAVEYLKEHSVDLILLDMIMDPGINGRETYKRIIEIHPKQKAIIISGFAETEDVKEAQKLGAGKYLKKPITLEKIGRAFKEELGK